MELGGEEVLVANVGGVFHAIGNRCTHRGGDLSAGRLEGRVVTCPRHGSRFDVTTGEALSGPKVLLLRLGTGDEPTYGLRGGASSSPERETGEGRRVVQLLWRRGCSLDLWAFFMVYDGL